MILADCEVKGSGRGIREGTDRKVGLAEGIVLFICRKGSRLGPRGSLGFKAHIISSGRQYPLLSHDQRSIIISIL